MKLSNDESRARFATARVARLASVAADGRPHLVPITFAMRDADRIVSAVDQKPKATTDLRRLRHIALNPGVAVLADHYSDDWARLWWVRADGHATVLPSGSESQAVIDALVEKYEQYRVDPPRGPAIEITVDAWTGWAHG